MNFTTNNEYQELSSNNDPQKRKQYWEVAKGLQKVDRLKTSDYLEIIIDDTLNDKYGTVEAEKKLTRYYEEVTPISPKYETKEADIVSARITLLLERGGFKFSPAELLAIHTELFRDVLPPEWVGSFRTTNITKAEVILDGRSVQYADYASIRDMLKYDFDEEKAARYTLPFTPEQVSKFANFTSNIWQTHPFREGNTRTIAVFLMLYLQKLGISINNEPFKEHAEFFRNALVRGNFSNIKDGIHTDMSFLQLFFENVLMSTNHALDNKNLMF